MNTESAEKKTLFVIIITLITMFAEIIIGHLTRSMALFADGCHMGTHALALFLTYITYILARKFADTTVFVHGTGKFGSLSGYTSSILLGITGVCIIVESVNRFFNPLEIGFNEAIIVAIIGFLVNILCILIMGHDDHCHEHGHEHNHEDYNFKSAYLHILADIMTSVFAIAALLAGKYTGWIYLDPFVGIIGGYLICSWAWGLIKSTASILLDAEDKELKEKILKTFEESVRFKNLKLWKVSECEFSLNAEVESELTIEELKQKISEIGDFKNIVISK